MGSTARRLTPPANNPTIRLARIRNGGTLIYAADSTGRIDTLYSPFNGNTWRYMNAVIYPASGASLYPRHSNGLNILFVDGHVALHSKTEVAVWAALSWSDPDLHFCLP
ncbi:MAG: hypothetical protein HY360_20890 [Verrucomicrobia bacterium]|nr:hypothetical protein [Verrucomicrobiota bacterium]